MTNSPSTRPTRTAPTVALKGMSESARAAAAALMPTTSGSFSLSAEKTSAITWVSLRKPSGNKRTNGAIDLAAGENFLFAGPAFALDEAAGNASTGVGVFAVVDGEGKEIDSLARIGRGYCGGQNDGFARGHQCGAGGLLGHAAGLKDQPLAAGKLDSYFMLGRHRVLFSFFSLGKLVVGRRGGAGAEHGDADAMRLTQRVADQAAESGCSSEIAQGTAQPIAVRRPWQQVRSPGTPWPQVLGGTGAVTNFRSGRFRVNVSFLITCGYRVCRSRRDSDRNRASSGNPAGGGAC